MYDTVMVIHSALLLAALAHGSGVQEPVKLHRVFSKGEKAEYEVKSTIFSEQRVAGLETWIPEDLELNYRFSYEVTELKADGICDLRYKRPVVNQIEGETFDSPPKKTVEKLNWDMVLTVSPINEVLNIKDLTKKPEEKPKGGGGVFATAHLNRAQDPLGDILGQFIGEVFRLALFFGSLDSSLDFAPKFPFDEVKPGDTWKRTVGYSPQKLQGKEKLAVQRLDYTYTYRGMVDSGQRKVHRVTAELELKTDLATFIHQTFQIKPEQTGLKEVPLAFKGTIAFDLDPKTFRTLRADAESQGEFKVVATFLPNQAAQEVRFKGRTMLRPLSK
jgi:hypothetical protein